MVVAYLRVSTEKQILSNQKAEIKKFACDRGWKVNRWEEETVSGTKETDDRLLGRVLEEMQDGDKLIVSELSRLSRSFWGVVTVLERAIRKGIIVCAVKEDFQFADDLNSKVLSFAFSLVAELERDLISLRTKEALARLKAKGVVLGRPIGSRVKKKILEKNKGRILQMREEKILHSKIAATFHVSRTTLFNFLKETEAI